MIYAEAYQFYYPARIAGYRMMGDAFVMENKIGLAMVQYTRALQGDPTDPDYATTLTSRAAIYASQGRDDLALADLTQAVTSQPQVMAYRQQRLALATRLGAYETIGEDLEALQAANAISDTEFTIQQTRLRVAQNDMTPDDQQQALADLRRLNPDRIPDSLRPVTSELVARLELALGDEAGALQALDAALNEEETVSRRLLRGQILQLQAEAATRDDVRLPLYQAAQREYDFVLSWGVVYRYPFLEEAEQRYDVVTDEITRLEAALAEAS